MQELVDITPIVAHLNPAQKEAVTAPPDHRLVLAGAGSGKTRVLVHRIAWLIAVENVSPLSILAVTFTNKAASEMRGRIEQLVTVPMRSMWVGTFHGIAHRLLRLHWKEAGLVQNFQILDSDDQLRLVKRVLKGLDLSDEQWPPKAVTGWINAQKEEARRPHHLNDLGDYTQRQYLRIYTAYEEACAKSGMVDFAELLLRAFELTRDNADIQAHYRRRFRHLLVDEFQDTNTLQYAWLRVMAGDSGTMFAVGDDDQCAVRGTQITMGDGSTRAIEKVRAEDRVLSCYGPGDFRPATVLRTHRTRRTGSRVTIVTTSGMSMTTTPEHTHFAGYILNETPQTFFAYLMFKRDVGYRLGVSQVYTRGQARPLLGFRQRCLHEHADALWVLSTHASPNLARVEEALLSLRYGLPTLPFVARKGKAVNGFVHDPLLIRRIFESLDTASSAARLLADHNLSIDEPHHCPQGRNSIRHNVVVTLCGDRRGASPMHRISVVGVDPQAGAQLAALGLSVRAAKAGAKSWRFETCRKDFGEVLAIAKQIETALSARVVLQGHLGARSLPFTRAASVRAGMAVLGGDGKLHIVERVEWSKDTGSVFDLDIENTHNYVADGIVTHNSIYSWRGARVENMARLEKDFPGTEVIRLEQNYRSTGTILKAANGLIARNTNRLGKNLWTDGGEGEQIQLYAAFNEYDEAEFVANRIREHLDGRCRHTDIAILYRSNAQSRVLEEILIRARIPYRIYGGLRFFERQEIKDALAYLRLLHNRDDDTSFERAVNTPTRGIGNTTMEKLREIARASGVSLWQSAKNASKQLGRSAGNVLQFLKLIDDLHAETREMPLSKATEHVIARSGLKDHYRKEKGEQAEGRLENLDELVSAARSFETQPPPPPVDEGGVAAEPMLDPLTAFLTHAALESGEEQAGPGEDCVQLMTLHAAKGLEFPVVFIVGVENGVFPSMRAVDEGNLEEERRLFYVGITRARRKLYLSYAEIRRVHGVEQLGAPSMFLKEVPAECIVETRPRAGVLRPGFGAREPGAGYGQRTGMYGGYGSGNTGGYPARPMARPGPVAGAGTGPGGFRLGQRVEHGKFGEGTILAFDGDGDRARVEVKFREAGTKWLMLGIANLRGL